MGRVGRRHLLGRRSGLARVLVVVSSAEQWHGSPLMSSLHVEQALERLPSRLAAARGSRERGAQPLELLVGPDRLGLQHDPARKARAERFHRRLPGAQLKALAAGVNGDRPDTLGPKQTGSLT